MTNDNTKPEQFNKQVFDVKAPIDYEASIPKPNNILSYILEITNVNITKKDDHPDSICSLWHA